MEGLRLHKFLALASEEDTSFKNKSTIREELYKYFAQGFYVRDLSKRVYKEEVGTAAFNLEVADMALSLKALDSSRIEVDKQGNHIYEGNDFINQLNVNSSTNKVDFTQGFNLDIYDIMDLQGEFERLRNYHYENGKVTY